MHRYLILREIKDIFDLLRGQKGLVVAITIYRKCYVPFRAWFLASLLPWKDLYSICSSVRKRGNAVSIVCSSLFLRKEKIFAKLT